MVARRSLWHEDSDGRFLYQLQTLITQSGKHSSITVFQGNLHYIFLKFTPGLMSFF